jgi:succinyl-CoA synthetase alpha subunit
VAILIDHETNIIVQGGTGKQGSFHVKLMKKYGTKIVGLVTPGSRLDSLEEIPVYNSVSEAIKASRVDATLVFVPPMACKEAVAEAAYNGVKLIVVITEHVPLHDAIIMKRISNQKGAMLIGPNTIGVISAGLSKMGVMPADLYRPGVVGLASYLKARPGKPVVTYIAGRSAPPEKRMGHAGALISGTQATAEAKVRALREAGATVVDYPDQIPAAFNKLLEKIGTP